MRLTVIASLCLVAGGIAAATPALAQHATAEDIADGQRAFASNCAVCHGPDGNIIPNIDFSRGIYRREYTDAELVDIIQNGIPNTAMPATARMTVAQAERIVAYLRDLPAQEGGSLVAGDVTRGREVFFAKGACDDCHAVGGSGSRKGPDLSRIGLERRALEIEDSILNPAAVVQPNARTVRVRTDEGDVVTGRLLNQDTFTVQLIDDDEKLRSFDRSELRDFAFVASPMPSYVGMLSAQEIADLVAYLTSQQGF
jgi:putative heme-binding domain-containing protein